MRELPPWMSLPKEVRQRVVERHRELYPEQADIERYRQELKELGMYRIMMEFKLDLGAVLEWVKEEGAHDLPSEPQAWTDAFNRTTKRMKTMATDPDFIERSAHIIALVEEELGWPLEQDREKR